MKIYDELDVYVDLGDATVRAGTLGASFAGGRNLGSAWFVYSDKCFKTPGSYALSRTFLERNRAYIRAQIARSSLPSKI